MRGRKAARVSEPAATAHHCLDCTDEAEATFAGLSFCGRHALVHLIDALRREAMPEGEPVQVGAGASRV